MHTPQNPAPSDRPAPRGSSALIPLSPVSPDDAPTVITPHRTQSPSDPSLRLTAGGTLGHFELIEAIGSGGMAQVLKARDAQLGRVVALKILPPHMARDPENVTRFKHEARAAAKLDHDNVARVFFCGEDQGLHFIAFEFVEGETLKALIDRRGVLPPAECVRDMLGVAAGLAHAAERGVVHRDVKPSNIVVTPEGKAKVVDMGLARNLHATVNGGVTQSGVTLGTFDYISPEQALDPRRADARSDIYSLGCTFYHALTGRPPVPEGTAAKKLYHHQHEPVLDPRVLNPAVPDELAAVLATMMAKDPGRRYQTYAELTAALAALARLLNVETDVPPGDASTVRLLPQPPRVPVGLVVGLATLAVAAAVVVGVATHRGGGLPWDDGTSTRPTQPADPPPGPTGTTPQPPDGPIQVARNSDEFVRLLGNETVTEIQLLAGHVYDLTTVTEPAVVRGSKKTVVGLPGVPAATVRAAAVPADPANPTAPRPGALTAARVESLTFRNVRFEVADARPADDPTDRPAAVAAIDVGSVSFVECRFDPAPGLETADAAGLAVHQTGRDATTLTVRNCYFGLRRGAAVRLAGRVRADATESAFAPHPAAFALGAVGDGAGELTLRHCTFLIDRGAAAEADDGAKWVVSAGHCVFAAGPPPADPAMMMPDPTGRRPVVLRALAEKADAGARLQGLPGQPNAYFQVAPFAAGNRAYTFDDAKQLSPSPAADPGAVELKQSPWAADPAAGFNDAEPRKAFRLKTTKAVRATGDEVVLGLRDLTPDRAGPKIYDPWPPAFQTDEVADKKVKVWWPHPDATALDSLPRNVFTQLEEAIAAAKPGDVIRVRHNGTLRVPPQQLLNKAKLRLTIKPDDGFAPVLTLGESDQLEPSLFRLVDGEELVLEGLQIRLRGRPAKSGAGKLQSVVTVVGGRRCVLRDCVVTLDPQEDEELSAVALADPGGGEMRTGDDRLPAVRFERCLIRGKGRAVSVPSARPFELDMDSCVTALAGAVLDVNPPTKPSPAGAVARVRLTRLTAALSGPLFDLDLGQTPAGGKPVAWVPVEVELDRCLFAMAERGHAVNVLQSADPMNPQQALAVTTRGPNWYANFPASASFLDVTPADPATQSARSLDAEAWFGLTGESAARSVGRVTFATPGAGRRPTTVTAADLAVKDVTIPDAKPGDAGADPTKVAKPAEEGG